MPSDAANEVLDEYLESVGGREKIMADNRKALDRQAAKKKRGRSSTAAAAEGARNGTAAITATKRSKLAYGNHPGASTPPASRDAAEWQPPVGSWEDKLEISGVHITPENGRLWVMVEWKEDGRKTQHTTDVIYLRCPQKVCLLLSAVYCPCSDEANAARTHLQMLKYYESKVVIRETSPEVKTSLKDE